jgi:hypothetical protein
MLMKSMKTGNSAAPGQKVGEVSAGAKGVNRYRALPPLNLIIYASYDASRCLNSTPINAQVGML